MKRICYLVVMSLDGYIAGPKGEVDWITTDPEMDFAALGSRFDTILVGRKTFEPMVKAARTGMPGMRTVVVSGTLRARDYPGVTVIGRDAESAIASLRAGSGKDIWLFGGGELFGRLLAAGLVDGVEVGVMPVLLGDGIPLLPSPAERARLKLVGHRVRGSGIVSLEYVVLG